MSSEISSAGRRQTEAARQALLYLPAVGEAHYPLQSSIVVRGGRELSSRCKRAWESTRGFGVEVGKAAALLLRS